MKIRSGFISNSSSSSFIVSMDDVSGEQLEKIIDHFDAIKEQYRKAEWKAAYPESDI